jgi:hypothetical protein
MAVYTPKLLNTTVVLTASAVTVYTVPGSTVGVIRTIMLTNTDSSARTFTVSVGTDAAGTRIFQAVSLAAGETKIYNVWLAMPAATIVQAYASVTTVVNIRLSGYEYA